MGTTNYAANNSQVAIETIGDTTETALTCRTDSTICCRGRDNPNSADGLGDWLFPNGTAVVRIQDITDSDTDVLYRSRDTGSLRLHRRGSVSGPTGSYCCVIPDSTGEDVTFCVQLGKWICVLIHFTVPVAFYAVTEVITTSPLTTSKWHYYWDERSVHCVRLVLTTGGLSHTFHYSLYWWELSLSPEWQDWCCGGRSAVIAVTVVMVTYLVLRYKRGGEMWVCKMVWS